MSACACESTCLSIDELALHVGELVGQRRELLLLDGDGVGHTLFAVLEDPDVAFDGLALLREVSGLFFDLPKLRGRLLGALLEGEDAVLSAFDGGFLRARFVARREGGGVGDFELLFGRVGFEASALELRFAGEEARACFVGVEGEALDFRALHHDPAAQLEELVRGVVELEVFELVPVRDEPLGLRGLALERTEVPLDLRDDVADAQQVLLRELHLALRLLLACS